MSELPSHDPQRTPDAPPAAVAARVVSTTRRRLLRAGALGAPALVALKPAPVIACTCKLPSGFTVSGNLSRGPKNCAEPSELASVWAPRVKATAVTGGTEYRYMTSGGTVLTIHRDTTLASLGISVGSYGGTKVGDWIGTANLSDTGLFMACYLTAWAHSNGSNFPAKTVLVQMWNQGVLGSGYLPPNQTVAWGRPAVIGYLKFLTAQTA